MLLAFDLDNTVVTADHRLPNAIAEAVGAAREAGHHVTVLTGRPEFMARPFVTALGVVPGPFSVNHGATVFGADGRKAHERRLEASQVATLVGPGLAPPGVPFSCVADDVLFVEDPDDPRWAWAHTKNRRVRRFDPEAVASVHKVVFGTNGDGPDLQRRLRAALPVDTYLWADGNLEVTARHADKGTALKRIAAMLRVPREETVAFGDGLNDLTMLRWAGHGVSVGPHAAPEVRRAAGEHVDAPETLGVANWLRLHAH